VNSSGNLRDRSFPARWAILPVQGRRKVSPIAEYLAIISLSRLGRVLRKSPIYVAGRAWHELISHAERVRAPRRVRRTDAARLARVAGKVDVAAWWNALLERNGPTPDSIDAERFDQRFPGESRRLLAHADRAVAHHVDLLGSGQVDLGAKIDWQLDFKSGHRWAPAFCKSIAYNHLDRPSDVKVPWELSRMQWLVPVGQAYALTGEDRYAAKVRDLVDDWIYENPHAATVNWACTMDVALRAICWIWFFHVFGGSPAWANAGFRERFLTHLYLHGDFVSRHLEKADVNGNHYAADAAGLAMVGQFFEDLPDARRWRDKGWTILSGEILKQVFVDGVDFEASVPYHRLVLELFLWPALYRRRGGMSVASDYYERLAAMGRFAEAYSRPDGSAPLWGDADDARVLPFGGQDINDHRYLIGLVGLATADADLVNKSRGPGQEIAWALGLEALDSLPAECDAVPRSIAFPQGGFFILRDARNHVFIDCGPLGLAGRGGHGHNDLLSFEATIDGVNLISDCGAYLYTADYRERNNFRSTAYHNTPQIDGEEINRFLRPDLLWTLRNDARPTAEHFEPGEVTSAFTGSHDGYRRLADPVLVRRAFELDHVRCVLTIAHDLSGHGHHCVEIPFHLAPGVEATMSGGRHVRLRTSGRVFDFSWEQDGWEIELTKARVSPSYGVVVQVDKIMLRRRGALAPLSVTIG